MSSPYRLLTYGNSAKYSDILEQWIRSITIDSDAPELVIYSLPGMGKTTFQKKQIRKGFVVSDSDDFTAEWMDKEDNKRRGLDRWASPVKERKDRFAYEQEMAWRLPLVNWPSNTRFTVTNMFNHALKGVMKLDQTLVMVRAESFDVYWSRAKNRADLAELGEATLRRWYEDSSGLQNIVNFTVSDWDDGLEEHLTNNISAFGAYNVTDWKSDKSSRFDVARMLRDNILVHFAPKHRLHFVGSERQTVTTLAHFGARAHVSGKYFDKPIDLKSALTLIAHAPSDFIPPYTKSDGQKKLLTSNMAFYGADCSVIVSVGGGGGGEAGSHLLELFAQRPMHKRIVVIDPLPLSSAPPDWITYIPSLFDIEMLKSIVGKSDFVFISDIRSDGFSEDDVERDNQLQLSWAQHILRRYPHSCRGISLKYRPSKDARIISLPSNFDVLLQCYAGGGSEETRLCWRPSNSFKMFMETQSAANYRSVLRDWNYARTFGNHEESQARALSHYLIQEFDYVRDKPTSGEIVVALYTLSNFDRDVRPLLKDWSEARIPYICNLPFAPIYKALASKGDVPDLRSVGGNDSSWIPLDFVGYSHSYRISDFITQLRYANDFAALARQPGHCNGGSRYMHEWFICTNLSQRGLLPYSPAHTIQNSQTWCVKAITAKIRLVYGLDDSALHKMRRQVIESRGGTPIDHRLVNGKIDVDGRSLYISISGHLINLLIAATVYAIDFGRWVDTLRFALETKYRSARKWKALWEKGILAEDAEKWDFFQLYHGYFDYRYSLDAYARFCDEFDLFKNNMAVAFVERSLDELVVLFPEWKYDEGYAVEEYLLETELEDL